MTFRLPQYCNDGIYQNLSLSHIINDGTSIIDQLVAESWLYQGFYDYAITKYKEALSHIDAAFFPSPEEKDLALAQIYEMLAQIYSKYSRPADIATAAQAALALDESASNHLYLCYSYHLMTQNTEAVAECSKILSDPENGLNGSYWRGLSYKELHDDENAIPDLLEVAFSQNGHRAVADRVVDDLFRQKRQSGRTRRAQQISLCLRQQGDGQR